MCIYGTKRVVKNRSCHHRTLEGLAGLQALADAFCEQCEVLREVEGLATKHCWVVADPAGEAHAVPSVDSRHIFTVGGSHREQRQPPLEALYSQYDIEVLIQLTSVDLTGSRRDGSWSKEEAT